MKRLRVDRLPLDGVQPLPPTVSHHLVHVLRARAGAPLRLFDGRGAEQPASLDHVADGVAYARPAGPVEAVASAADGVTLVVSVLKHQAMDLALRMATEAGVAAIRPVHMERTVATGDRGDRWARIVSAAAAQCGRAAEPVVHPVVTLAEALLEVNGPLFYGDPGAPGAPRCPDAVLVVGPAGGLGARDRSILSMHQAAPIGLGLHVLRAETACAVGPALLMR